MVSRLRLQYCKIILATSLVWFLLDVVLLMYFTDCATHASTDCNTGGKDKKPEGGSLLQKIIPKDKFSLEAEFCEVLDKDSCRQMYSDFQSSEGEQNAEENGVYSEFRTFIKVLRKQFENNEQILDKKLKDFDEQFEGKVKTFEQDLLGNLEKLASNVETRIQMREKEIDGSFRLAVKEVEGSIKVFETEVESYMRKVVRNIDENLVKREKDTMEEIVSFIGAVEKDIKTVVLNVKGNIHDILTEVKDNLNNTLLVKSSVKGDHVAIVDCDVDDKAVEIKKEISFESGVLELGKTNADQFDANQMESVSHFSLLEQNLRSIREMEQRLIDDSLWFSAACQRGEVENCRKPDWIGSDMAYMFDMNYYLMKDPGDYDLWADVW